MNLHTVSAVTIAALMCTLVTFLSRGDAQTQRESLKEQLTGTWIVVSTDQTAPGGVRHQVFGPNPKGLMVLDASGRYVQIITRPDLPKFKANSRLEGTAEENKAAVQGTTATFGTWSVDESNKTLIIRIEGGLFPNQSGTESRRAFTLNGDELKTSNPVAGAGMTADSVYRRAR